MSFTLGTLAISSGVNATFQAPSDGSKAVLIGNESGLTVTVIMEGGGVGKTLYPGTVDWFQINRGFTGTIIIRPVALLNNSSTWPASSLQFDSIGINDPEQAFSYPFNLNRSSNIGNTIPVNTSTSNLVNDTNPTGTTIVEATVSGDGASSVKLTNNGGLTLGSSTRKGQLAIVSEAPGSGAYSDVLELGNGSQIGVFGSAAVDLQLLSAGIIAEKIGGVQQWHISSGGVTLDHGTITLLAGSLSRMVYTHIASVTTVAAFVNHNLGVAPDFCFLIPNDGTLSTGNFNAYYDSGTMTSTQVKLQSNSVGGIPVGLIAVKL